MVHVSHLMKEGYDIEFALLTLQDVFLLLTIQFDGYSDPSWSLYKSV
jgi:hypothetical protein